MAQRAIREHDGKRILHRCLDAHVGGLAYDLLAASVAEGHELRALAANEGYAWLAERPLVVKPDMVFGKRGKNGLVYFRRETPGDVHLDEAADWIDARRAERTRLRSGQTGVLSRFIVEPFVTHEAASERYFSAVMDENDDVIRMGARGGIDVEERWDELSEVRVPALAGDAEAVDRIREGVPPGISDPERFLELAIALYRCFRDLHFSYLEVNPFVLAGERTYLLDLVARVDDTAGYLMHDRWGPLYFPTPFGMKAPGPEEQAIKTMDEKSGASMKLTVLNAAGRIWTLVAGGGASVVYADTIADLGGIEELANYGEYSGNPTTEETYVYTRTVLDLMTRESDPEGRDKALIIGGAIANFTDVAKTFTGIIKALKEYRERLRRTGVRIYVRRGGPSFEVGLKRLKKAAGDLGLPIQVHGPETHMTDIVRMALAA